MPGLLNAAVCGGLRRFRKNSNRRTVNPLTDMAERRFVRRFVRRSAAVLGNPQKIRLRRSAAVVRYSPPIPPYAPLARFRSARGAAPGGATSRLVPSSSMAKSAPSTALPFPLGWPFFPSPANLERPVFRSSCASLDKAAL